MEQILSPELSQPITTLPTAPIAPSEIDPLFSTTTTNLASAALGTKILSISDEFFAPAANLLTPTPPISKPGVFIPTGAWYDGWESRRHNARGFDSVVLRLGTAAGVVSGVEVDTAFFTGNAAPAVSVEGCFEPGGADGDARVASEAYVGWKELLPRRECEPNLRHAWRVGKGAPGEYEGEKVTHVRLRMYPDGGIARFRVYGTAVPVWEGVGTEVELSAAVNGGIATAWSDQHYGKAGNLILPGRGKDMGDGWETKRSRGEGHTDWAVIRLGARGTVSRVVIDTMHFRGNFPREVVVELGDFPPVEGEEVEESMGRLKVAGDEQGWVKVASRGELGPDTEFEFAPGKGLDGVDGKAWTHAKLTMVPDGGVKRFRIFGQRA